MTGFTLWQVSLPFETREELESLAREFFKDFPVDEYPYFVEHGEWHLGDSASDGATEVAFGLDLILDGLERIRDAA
jgi:hypothetical protein